MSFASAEQCLHAKSKAARCCNLETGLWQLAIMYGPPPDCKRRLMGQSSVCVNVSGLWLEGFSSGPR
jgi:hypothetical protein